MGDRYVNISSVKKLILRAADIQQKRGVIRGYLLHDGACCALGALALAADVPENQMQGGLSYSKLFGQKDELGAAVGIISVAIASRPEFAVVRDTHWGIIYRWSDRLESKESKAAAEIIANCLRGIANGL